MKHNKINGEFVLESGNRLYAMMFLLVAVMLFSATKILISQVKMFPYGASEIFGICFALLWYVICFFILRFSIKRYSQKLIINSNEVRLKYILPIAGDDVLKWKDVADYGYTYYNKASDQDPWSFELYFSSVVLKNRNGLKAKNTQKSKIRFFIMQEDLKFIEEYIFPYCGEYSPVKPFISEFV